MAIPNQQSPSGKPHQMPNSDKRGSAKVSVNSEKTFITIQKEVTPMSTISATAAPALSVADFRGSIDHLERVYNVDRCACVGDKEKALWADRCKTLVTEVEGLTCPRAKAADNERHSAIVKKVTAFLAGDDGVEVAPSPAAESGIVYLAHRQLVLNPTNRLAIRDKAVIKANAASIQSVGILQNLVVSPLGNDTYQVEAGNGRYASVNLLIQAGDATEDFLYPCLINDSEWSADAIKLIENGHREALHPVDEFLSFARLINDDKKTLKEVATALSVSQKYIKQRMKLAALAPAIIDAFKEGKMDIEEAEAFTLSTDHEQQLQVWELERESGYISAHRIRRLLTEDKIAIDDPLVNFVGLAAYKKTGGRVQYLRQNIVH